jgi:hypothetical protein
MSDSDIVTMAKGWLRWSTNSKDSEILMIVNSCLNQLYIAGIVENDIENVTIQGIVRMYVLAMLGPIEARELWMKAYEAYKIALALSSDYNGTNSTESEED